MIAQIVYLLKIECMEDKNKLFVFEKKEVLLLFSFVILSSAIAFTIGVEVGHSIKLTDLGITDEDKKTVELKSQKEEYTEKLLNDKDDKQAEKKDDFKISEEESIKKLQQEIEKVAAQNPIVKNEDNPMGEVKAAEAKTEPAVVSRTDETNLIDSYNLTDQVAKPISDTTESNGKVKEAQTNLAHSLKGKFTIQVGAYKELKEAKDFGSGFEVRGYSPIVNEVSIPNKGTWYRVSLGAFD
ncbi:MAG: cell division septation protein DedD, partial [Thermoproteota archaeon]